MPPAYPAFTFFSAPIPPPPSPPGKGEIFSLFRRGLRPRHPCIRPFAALAVPAAVENATGACPARHWLDLPLWHPAGACFVCRLLPPAFTFFSAPYPPAPFPGGEGGALRLFYARGSAPCIPGAEPARHWGRGRTTHPAGVCLRNLQLGAKPTEPPFYWQCRQPRRGGTGTIRRKRRRRLRWSSPPGQGKQVPPGFSSPPPPRAPQRQAL